MPQPPPRGAVAAAASGRLGGCEADEVWQHCGPGARARCLGIGLPAVSAQQRAGTVERDKDAASSVAAPESRGDALVAEERACGGCFATKVVALCSGLRNSLLLEGYLVILTLFIICGHRGSRQHEKRPRGAIAKAHVATHR